jgi:GNAT superfamily N-acetyltransferase
MSGLGVRRATVADVDQLVELRVAFLRDAGHEVDEGPLRSAVAQYLVRALPVEDVVVWVAEDGGRIVATGAMTVYERMSWDGVSKEGYVLNMYTVPAFRKTGIASAIVDAMLDHARANDLRLALIALDDARAMYERAGFKADPRYLRWRP